MSKSTLLFYVLMFGDKTVSKPGGGVLVNSFVSTGVTEGLVCIILFVHDNHGHTFVHCKHHPCMVPLGSFIVWCSSLEMLVLLWG